MRCLCPMTWSGRLLGSEAAKSTKSGRSGAVEKNFGWFLIPLCLSGATINIMESGQKRRERSPEPGPLVTSKSVKIFLRLVKHQTCFHLHAIYNLYRTERGSSRYQAAPKRSEMILIIKKRKNNLDHPGGAGKIFDQHGNGPGQSRGGFIIISS